MATNRLSPYLPAALDSIAAQTYPNVEVIVVDDGCPRRDELDALLATRPGIMLIRQAASGSSIAWNTGVSEAHGELIGFAGDDDVWPPDWVEAHVRAHQGLDRDLISYAGIRVIDSDGGTLFDDPSKQVVDVREVLRREVAILGGTMLLPRHIFTKVGGFSSAFRHAEDLDLVLRCAPYAAFVHVPDVLLNYRSHAGNSTKNHRALALSIEAVLHTHLTAAQIARRSDQVADLKVSLAANDRFAAWSAARAARACLQHGEAGKALAEMVWAMRFAPAAPAQWARKRLSTLVARFERPVPAWRRR